VLLVYDLFPRLVATILLWTCALGLWDLLHVSPTSAARALRESGTRTIALGLARFAIGLVFAVTALLVLAFSMPLGALSAFSSFAILTFITGFIVDALIGDALRRALRLS